MSTTQELLTEMLSDIPKKLQHPITYLKERNLVKEEDLLDIVLAGKLSQNYQHLLGFGIAYMAMKKNGVPISDTIHMAAKLGSKVNLSWSQSRWKQQHDLYSRHITLKRLSDENIQYDLSKYERLLPDQFPGYLIKTSRRLGMEGIRQRHCVASYHHNIISGYYAIATVFIDKKRWTVCLRTFDNAKTGKQSLEISQIRSLLNEQPDNETSKKVSELLGINYNRETYYARDNEDRKQEQLKFMFAEMKPHLEQLGVESIEVSFAGYSDDGQIDKILPEPPGISLDEEFSFTIFGETWNHTNRCWDPHQKRENISLWHALSLLCHEILSLTGVDWYNGDGGNGCINIDVATAEFDTEVNVNVVEERAAYSEVMTLA